MDFKHLKEANESYLSHMGFSMKLFCILFVLSSVSLVHSIFPFLFSTMVSDKLNNILMAMDSKLIEDQGNA